METTTTHCVDALVFAWLGQRRYVALVERSRADSPGWALPGGKVEPDEAGRPLVTACREFAEETGLLLGFSDPDWEVGDDRLVPDPRPGAWITRVCRYDLGQLYELPELRGESADRRADWFRADSFDELTRDLRDRFGGRLFEGHIAMLIEFINAEWTGLHDDRT